MSLTEKGLRNIFGRYKVIHDLENSDNVYYAALCNSAAFDSTNISATSAWGDVSASWEISQDATLNSSGYDAGGKGLSGLTVSGIDSENGARWDADDISWPNATIETYGVVIYRASDGLLVNALYFGRKVSNSNGLFTLNWSSRGLLNML